MLKILGGVVIGVFVGALAFEILQRKSPGLIEEIERKAERVANSFLEAFQDGYRTRTKRTAA
jgi:hypothetical protein